MLKHLDLFSGIGGFSLAADWAGFETVAFVERDKYCQQVLAKHWQGVPIIEDVKEVTVERMGAIGVYPGNVDLITGGFPCQPFSHAGKRRGTEDDRYLWPEYLRIIREFKPTWICAENVRGLLSMDMPDEVGSEVPETVLATIRQDLTEAGYTSEVFLFPASAVGAHHKRERVFIVAHTEYKGCEYRRDIKTGREDNHDEWFTAPGSNGNVGRLQFDPGQGCEVLGNTTSRGLPQPEPESRGEGEWGSVATIGTCVASASWWSIEPNICRVANGVPSRVDRLKGLGNAVVPQQAYPILKAIADYERGCN